MIESDPATAQQPRRSRRITRFAVQGIAGLLVGGAALYFSFSGISLNELGTAIRGARWPWIVASGALVWVLFWIRSLRWQLMFPEETAPTLPATHRAFMLGALGNVMLPGRLGDVARTVMLGRQEPRIGVMGALSSLMLEKVLDGLVLLALFGGILLMAPVPAWLREGAFVAGASFGVALVGLLVLSHGRLDRMSWLQGSSRRSNLLVGGMHRLRQGLHGLGDGKRLAVLVVLTVMVWTVEFLVVTGCLRAMQINLPAEAALLSLVLLSVGTMVPAAPGFVGTYQLALIAALSLYGVEREQALAAGLLLNALVIMITLVFGSVALVNLRASARVFGGNRNVPPSS